jgi:hypothetical protein
MRSLITVVLTISLNSFSQISRTPGPDPGPEIEKLDSEGWLWIFDGTQESLEKYWWISDATHGDGGKWWVAADPDLAAQGHLEEGETILWSDQNPGGNGGVLYTHRKYKDVEVMVSFLPGWLNDAGLFLRANGRGSAYQVMYDYQPGNTIGGIMPQGSVGAYVSKLYMFVSETEIHRTGIAWTDDWLDVWDPDGFNEVYHRVIGRPVHIIAWIKAPEYIVTDFATNIISVALNDDGYIGIQILGGTDSWQGGPNKYKWIKIREIDSNGVPLYIPPVTDVLGCADSDYIEYNPNVTVHVQDSCKTLGVRMEFDKAGNLNFQHNPFNNSLTITFLNSTTTKSLSIHTITGIMVKQFRTTGNTVTWNPQQNGVYYIRAVVDVTSRLGSTRPLEVTVVRKVVL